MLYDLGLAIAYEYDQPAVAGRHILRLVPANLPGLQRRITGSLDITPAPSERRAITDFFGNAAVEVAFREQHDEILFRVLARIERLDPNPGLDISPGLPRLAEEIAACRSLDPDAPHHFLGPSPRTAPTPEMTAYARARLAPGITAVEAVRAVGLALHRDMAFDPEATTVDTPVEEAFALRRGVCQDFSHLMISALRGAGVPTGYVGGFLRTTPPKGQERLQGADAMHAWVRAWCGVEMGWVEYDPTNAMVVADDHIVLARGRDYADVSPVRGVLRSAGAQTSAHSVDVAVVEEK